MWNNQVAIVGNLGKDPDVRFTKSGDAVTTFGVAVSNGKNQDGSYRDPDWHNVVCFKIAAEQAADQLHKGDGVCVLGRMHINSWTDNEGNKRERTEIIADNVFIQMKKENKENGFDKMGTQTNDEDVPF